MSDETRETTMQPALATEPVAKASPESAAFFRAALAEIGETEGREAGGGEAIGPRQHTSRDALIP